MGLTIISPLPALYYSSSFAILFYFADSHACLTLHPKGTIAAAGPHGSLTSLVTRRTPISLLSLPSSSPFIPLGSDPDSLAGCIWRCHIQKLWSDSPPSKTLRFHGLKLDWMLSCRGCERRFSIYVGLHDRVGSCGSESVYQRLRQSVSLCPGKLSESPLYCRLVWIIGFHHLQEVTHHCRESSSGLVTLWSHFKARTPHAAGNTNTHWTLALHFL